jgi:hypothetical protein
MRVCSIQVPIVVGVLVVTIVTVAVGIVFLTTPTTTEAIFVVLERYRASHSHGLALRSPSKHTGLTTRTRTGDGTALCAIQTQCNPNVRSAASRRAWVIELSDQVQTPLHTAFALGAHCFEKVDSFCFLQLIACTLKCVRAFRFFPVPRAKLRCCNRSVGLDLSRSHFLKQLCRLGFSRIFHGHPYLLPFHHVLVAPMWNVVRGV